MVTDLTSLVRPEEGLISPHIFTDQAVYERELEQVFGRCWLFLAHECQLPRPGDFVSTYMGEDNVLLVRQRDGSLGAFLNACRHRGMRVCRADSGNARAFTCTYHGWTYDPAGRLVSVPYPDEGYGGDFDKDRWGLVPVAQLASYKGLVFATFDPTAPPLEEYLGDAMRFYIDSVFDRVDGGAELVGGTMKWRVKANWKFGAEQFTTDMFHLFTSHLSAIIATTPPEVMAMGPPPEYPPGRQFSTPHGHGGGFFWDGNAVMGDTEIEGYYAAQRTAFAARLGEPGARGPLTTGHQGVFPNFSYLPGTGVVRVWHPRGPDEMEIWSWVVVDKHAPAEVKEAQRKWTVRTFSPGGLFEQDDSENWGEVQRNLRGAMTKRTAWNYQMGLGHPVAHDADGLPGESTYVMSEMAGRQFYRRWLDLMEGGPVAVQVPSRSATDHGDALSAPSLLPPAPVTPPVPAAH
jgi:phenylpropionate dioxygenase-like ring-hydroxylating dioxygenase large terminal subunit